jgi:hypothetical protein
MKKRLIVFSMLVFVFSCKKKEDKKPVEPEPVKTGTLTVNIVLYDSLGQAEADRSGVTVKLANTAFAGVTSAAGSVSFSGVTQGLHYPVFIKTGYEGPPTSINLDSEAKTTSVVVARLSPFNLNNLAGQPVNKDSITISFALDKAIPAGKTCRIAVLYDSLATSAQKFNGVEFITVASQNTINYNISQLTGLKTFLNKLPNGKPYYISAVPISYGLYESNLSAKPVLLGDNLFFPDNLTFYKNW